MEFIPTDKKGTYWRCQSIDDNKVEKLIRTDQLKHYGCSEVILTKTFNNLLNQTFGRLKVIEKTDQRDNNGCIIWKCKCSCEDNTICYKSSKGLKAGTTKSCGCLKKELDSNKIISDDLINKRFGRLVAIKLSDERTIGGRSMWLCKCDCGKTKSISRNSLITGNTISCGCLTAERVRNLNFKNLINQNFGKLVVIEETSERRYNSVVWKCRCSCKNETIIKATTNCLVAGNVQSCGCITHSIGETNIKNILEQNNIEYKTQKTFPELKSKRNRLLSFDFEAKNDNLKYLIEFDGEQHNSYQPYFHNTYEDFLEAQERDMIKNQYCLKNSISLIRIPYWERDNITLEMLQLETSPYLYKGE